MARPGFGVGVEVVVFYSDDRGGGDRVTGHTFEPELDQPLPRAVAGQPDGIARVMFVVWLAVGGYFLLRVAGPDPFAAAWAGLLGWFLCVAFWEGWGRPWRDRRLATTGTPVVAVVTGTRVRKGKGPPVRRIAYRFADPQAAGRGLTGAFDSPLGGPDDRPVGTTLTALYDPTRPGRHVALAGSTYRPVRTPDRPAVS